MSLLIHVQCIDSQTKLEVLSFSVGEYNMLILNSINIFCVLVEGVVVWDQQLDLFQVMGISLKRIVSDSYVACISN